jgi:hypothetical protein
MCGILVAFASNVGLRFPSLNLATTPDGKSKTPYKIPCLEVERVATMGALGLFCNGKLLKGSFTKLSSFI